VGIAAQNLGPAIELDSSRANLPSRLSVGVAGFGQPVGAFDVGASFAVAVLRDGYVTAAAGTEWGYSPLEGYTFALRLGVRRPELREQGVVTGGGSITVDRFSLDYTLEQLRHGVAHRLAVRVR
jgi:hypothetical protein